jgi:hypothetical protein
MVALKKMPTPRFKVGDQFMAPDTSLGTVVSVAMDGFMPVYNCYIWGDPDGVVNGHIAEWELYNTPGWEVSEGGTADWEYAVAL